MKPSSNDPVIDAIHAKRRLRFVYHGRNDPRDDSAMVTIFAQR